MLKRRFKSWTFRLSSSAGTSGFSSDLFRSSFQCLRSSTTLLRFLTVKLCFTLRHSHWNFSGKASGYTHPKVSFASETACCKYFEVLCLSLDVEI